MANINKTDFRALAMKATTLSDLMVDKEKLSSEDIVREFPDGITLTDFDIVTTGEDTYPVFSIAEKPDHFYMGGAILYKIVNSFVEAFDGDIDGAAEEFAKSGGLKVKLSMGRTKRGNSLVKVTVI